MTGSRPLSLSTVQFYTHASRPSISLSWSSIASIAVTNCTRNPDFCILRIICPPPHCPTYITCSFTLRIQQSRFPPLHDPAIYKSLSMLLLSISFHSFQCTLPVPSVYPLFLDLFAVSGFLPSAFLLRFRDFGYHVRGKNDQCRCISNSIHSISHI